MAAEGQCVARHDGQVLFVRGVAPGDVADLRVVRTHRNYLEAVPTHFHSYSADRTEPFCQHFGTCGGCKWQHLTYESQLRHKQQQVEDALRRIGKIHDLPPLHPILPSEQTRYYRNKLDFTASPHAWLTAEQIATQEFIDRRVLGFHTPGRFDKILDIEHCHLQPEPSNALRLAVRAWAREHELSFYDVLRQTGHLRSLIIRTAGSTAEVMVIVQFAHDNDPAGRDGLLEMLVRDFPQITALHYVINQKGNDTIHDQEIITVKGPGYIQETMEDLTFRVGPKSFYQTNSAQALRLYQLTRELAGLTGTELVYDLYTGAGTIANFVARQASHVVGIEYVEQAIVDARVNSQINGVTNTTFYAGDMKDVLTAELIARHGRPDVVITDPPRAGMHLDVVAALADARPRRIVYVSCNPATQARDLEVLMPEGYRVTHVQPVDMFPHTHHVETVVALELVD